jgi:hypothetical protein
VFVKPAPGLKVRDPISKLHLAESGQEVPESSYWLRRLADGDVLLIDAPSKTVVQKNPIPDSNGKDR